MEMKRKLCSYISKIGTEPKIITRDKEVCYIMIKGLIYGKGITVLYIYATNIRSPKYMRQIFKDLIREINNTSLGEFSMPLQQLNIQICKETLGIKYTLDQMELNTYSTFHSTAEYTFFSFSVEHSPGSCVWPQHVFINLKRLIVYEVFSDHDSMRLVISCKKNTGELKNM